MIIQYVHTCQQLSTYSESPYGWYVFIVKKNDCDHDLNVCVILKGAVHQNIWQSSYICVLIDWFSTE